MAHLARFATSEVGLTRVLDRRIQRWARQAASAGDDPDEVRQRRQQAREAVRTVVSDMVRLKLIDDTMFADGRARALSRGGRSRRAIAAHLASRGIDAERIEGALLHAQSGVLDDAAQVELAAALLQARKRRLGPFAAQPGDGEWTEADDAARQRALAALARAGFSHDVARSALETDLETAETLIARLRSG
jgi:regulatory protein